MRRMHGIKCLGLVALLGESFALPPAQVPVRGEQVPISGDGALEHVAKTRPLHGRFLHVTDFHPDRFYQVYSSSSKEAACHRGQGPAGIYGAEMSDCDTPVALVNKTMEWIEQELKDSIDFVVWTADSARHDNDDEIPRNAKQVVGLNEFMVEKMFEVFGKHNGSEEDEDPNNNFIMPIIPNLGNNDILPHNVILKGPNTWTRTYAKVWRQFIPEAQKHQFEQGAWFYVEVVPNKLAVFSLNSLYFFQNNAAVDGCASRKEPGFQQMEWLRVQLQSMRERGVKAILTGHVPPVRENAKTLWDETCWQKYTLWLRQYRDVIVTSLYGHFNYDHFILQDFNQLDKATKHGRMQYYQIEDKNDNENNDELQEMVSADYWYELREDWAKLPKPPKLFNWLSSNDDTAGHGDVEATMKGTKLERKKRDRFLKKIGGRHAERFAASFVAASVVPNLYPTIRVYEYNTTGLEPHHKSVAPPVAWEPDYGSDVTLSRKNGRTYKFKVPEAPSKSAPPGPAYSPQTLSLLKYTQYYANITHINNDFHASDIDFDENVDADKWKEGKHKGKKAHEKDHTPRPRKFEFQVHYDTQDDDVYKLKDLTMPRLVDLARRIGDFEPEAADMPLSDDDVEVAKKQKKKRKKRGKGAKRTKKNEAWYTFIRRAFVETKDPEQLEQEYGH